MSSSEPKVHSLPRNASASMKEKYKADRKKYDMEKKRRKMGLLADAIDEQLGEHLIEGTLKIRSRLKNWHKFWGVVYPGKLVLYQDKDHESWKGTIILTGLQVQERPTKKSGFSFKCTTEFGQEIFARKGPRNEPFYNFAILPTDHCILRVGSEDEGRQWLVEIDKAQKLAADEVMSHRRSSGDFADSSFSSVSGASMRRHRSKSGNSASEQQPSSGDADTTAVDITNLSPQDLEIGGEINETRWTSASGTCVATTDTAAQRTTLPDVVHTALWKMMSTVTVGKEFETRLASAVPVGLLEPVSCLDKLGSAFASTAILASAAKERDPTARLLGIVRAVYMVVVVAPVSRQHVLRVCHHCRWREREGDGCWSVSVDYRTRGMFVGSLALCALLMWSGVRRCVRGCAHVGVRVCVGACDSIPYTLLVCRHAGSFLPSQSRLQNFRFPHSRARSTGPLSTHRLWKAVLGSRTGHSSCVSRCLRILRLLWHRIVRQGGWRTALQQQSYRSGGIRSLPRQPVRFVSFFWPTQSSISSPSPTSCCVA
eukprot:m.1398072 g.1398072  ORF g.1398072 m.1398072 type:complete len:541 (+) comp24999_c0_seq15:258-1880(+)